MIDLHDRSGKPIGIAVRHIEDARPHAVEHTLLFMEHTKGQGFGARFNAHAEAAYRAHGITRIELHANIDVGGYAWARAGYQFRTNKDRSEALGQVLRSATSHPHPGAVREVLHATRNPRFEPIDIAMIGHTPGAKTWLGKELMLGTDWHGVKHL